MNGEREATQGDRNYSRVPSVVTIHGLGTFLLHGRLDLSQGCLFWSQKKTEKGNSFGSLPPKTNRTERLPVCGGEEHLRQTLLVILDGSMPVWQGV